MQTGIKKWILSICVAILTIACINIGFDYVTRALESTNRTEVYAPNEYNISLSNRDEYTKIYENNNFEYYYSGGKTILKIVNKKSGFVWSTGADTDKLDAAKSKCSGITKYSNEYYACAIDIGPTRNGKDTSDISFAEINGLVYFTLLNDSKGNPSRSNIWAMTKNTTSGFYGHKLYANEWMFKLSYVAEGKSSSANKDSSSSSESVVESDSSVLDSASDTSIESSALSDSTSTSASSSSDKNAYEVFINMRLTFTEDGFDLNIYDGDITGKSRHLIEAIYPLPLLGQSGGKMLRCSIDKVDEYGKGDCKFDENSTIFDNPRTNLDGYIFVPDGSGALIRFDNVKYYDSSYTGTYFDMYKDPYKETYNAKEFQKSNETSEPDFVPTKHISMPVWGVSYGNNQDAFVAYVTKGSEYFGLLYNGRTLSHEYATIRPRFERNRIYVYRYGDTAPEYAFNEKETFYYDYDIGLSYNFLHGDGSDGELPANYVGMALKYRDHLLRNNLVKEDSDIKVGPRVDFLMSDAKEGIFGYSEVDVTSCSDVTRMLTDLYNDNIKDVKSTLYGWQNGGLSKARPSTVKWNKNLGGKRGFKDVVSTAATYGYTVDFYQQYSMVNEAQYSSFNGYAVKALSRDYGKYILSDTSKPMLWWYYTNSDVAGNWLNKQADEISKLGDNVGIATGGLSTLIVPDYGKKLSYAASKNSIYQSTKEAASKLSLSGDTPNEYLWKNYDSFTNISVYNSQLQCETDSVPFMEIALSGLVNMYAEYANFSFYDNLSKLKMIEYNLNPSFIISAEENTDIMYTNSRDWFSTSYSSYHEIIKDICGDILPVLELVKGKTIVGREVVEQEDGSVGIYVNTYASFKDGKIGNDKVTLTINYYQNTVTYNDGTTSRVFEIQ